MPVQNITEVLQDPKRLEVLQMLNLLDTPAEVAFDRLTYLVSKITNSPVSLVSLVDADRQFFKSFLGLAEPWASKRETPLSHSFCQHVVASGSALIVEDARLDPMLKDNLAIPDLNVIAYLGVPLTTSEGVELGSFCVIDSKPRQWSEAEIEIVRELALSVMTEIELRYQVKVREQAEKELIERNRQYQRVLQLAKSTINHMHDTIGRGAKPPELVVYLDSIKTQLAKL